MPPGSQGIASLRCSFFSILLLSAFYSGFFFNLKALHSFSKKYISQIISFINYTAPQQQRLLILLFFYLNIFFCQTFVLSFAYYKFYFFRFLKNEFKLIL